MSNRAERRARVKNRSRNTKGVRHEELLRRRMQRGDSALVHGICRKCSKRKILVQPARLCERCLLTYVPADHYVPPTPEQQLAYLDEVLGEEDDDVAVS